MGKDPNKLARTSNPLAEADDGLLNSHRRSSNDLIYETVMRGGGEPFGRPFELGIQSLTEKIVRLLRQHGFFGFEALDQPHRPRQRNKFTRYGASSYRGRPGKRR